MKKLSKHIGYLMLSSSLLLFYSCGKPNFLKNKYRVLGFYVEHRTDSSVTLNLAVKYFSDSTHQNYFADTMDKGQDGTDSVKLVFKASPVNEKDTLYAYLEKELNAIANNINANLNMFSGKFVKRPIPITLPANYDASNVSLVLIDEKHSTIDTLRDNFGGLQEVTRNHRERTLATLKQAIENDDAYVVALLDVHQLRTGTPSPDSLQSTLGNRHVHIYGITEESEGEVVILAWHHGGRGIFTEHFPTTLENYESAIKAYAILDAR